MATLGLAFRIQLLFISGINVAQADYSLCNQIVIKDGTLKLAKNEKTLVCGTSQDVEGWREVPLPQAQYQLSVILQNAGYSNPHFERDLDKLSVWKGPLLTTQRLVVNGANGLINPDKKRKVVGYPLTPAKLDEVSRWADQSLRRQGYACPELKVEGDAWLNEIATDITPNGRKRIGKIERSGLESLDPAAIRRYEAYRQGQWYDVIETEITTSRLLNDGLFQSAYVTTECHDDLADLHLVTNIGKPRLIRFGLGASSEELPFADLKFMNARLDNKASNYTATLHASPIWQSLNLNSELYFMPQWPTIFLGPNFVAEHRKERAFNIERTALGVDLGRAWDLWKTRLDARTGPIFTYEKTLSGIGPSNANYLSWQVTTSAQSHAYEAFLAEQNQGWIGGLNYRTQHRGLGAPIDVERWDANFKHLWNLGAYSPPLFVLATRLAGTVVNAQFNSDAGRKLVPVDYRIYYGGDENLRGFARESLNNGGLGYLTALYAGFELRLVAEIPYRIEPFLLYDVGKLGDRPFAIGTAVYSSPGVGVRWESPIGTLRATLAQGYVAHSNIAVTGYREQLVAFLSFGEEF
jgi:outer membrane translocation and assembly module TamA